MIKKMNSFIEIVETIKDHLSVLDEFENINFIISSTSSKVPNPINKIYVTLGIDQIEISQGAFSGYLGILEDKEIYGDLNDINVGMKIYLPKTMDGEICYDVFSKIYGALLEEDNNFNIQSIKCEKVNYDSKVSAYTMECEIKISTLVGHEEIEEQE